VREGSCAALRVGQLGGQELRAAEIGIAGDDKVGGTACGKMPVLFFRSGL